MRFSASVAPDGSLRVYVHERWAGWLAERKGQRLEVELRDEAAIRSNRQNRYWWAVCVKTVQECWQLERGDRLPLPKEHVHDALVMAFGGGLVETPLGRTRKSSASMTVEEFSKLIEATAEYLHHKYGCVLPKPEEWSEA